MVKEYNGFSGYIFECNGKQTEIMVKTENSVSKAVAEYLQTRNDVTELSESHLSTIISDSQRLFSNLYYDAEKAGTLDNFIQFMILYADMPGKVRQTLKKSAPHNYPEDDE